MSGKVETEIRRAYAPRVRVVTEVVGESLTEQAHGPLCDVTSILQRYGAGGVPQRDVSQARYLACPSVDFRTMLDMVREAERSFGALPASLRAKVRNRPEELVALLERGELSEDMRAELVKAGVLVEQPADVAGKPGEKKEVEGAKSP